MSDITKTWIEKGEACFRLVGYRNGNSGERLTYGTLEYDGKRGGNPFRITCIETALFNISTRSGKDKADQVRQILIVSYLTFMSVKYGSVHEIQMYCDSIQRCEYIKSNHQWGGRWEVKKTFNVGPTLTCNDWVTDQYLYFMQKYMGFKPTIDRLGISQAHSLTMKSDQIKKLQERFILCDDGFEGVYIVDTEGWNDWKFQSKIKKGEIIDWVAGLDCSVTRIKDTKLNRGTHDHLLVLGTLIVNFSEKEFHRIACQIPHTKHKRKENIEEGDAVYNTKTRKFGTVSDVKNGCWRKIFIKWTDGKSQRWHKYCISGKYIEECYELFIKSTTEKYDARQTQFRRELRLRSQKLRSLGADRDYIKPPAVWREIRTRQDGEQ